MARDLKIRFSVSGYVDQTIRIHDDGYLMSDAEIVAALNGAPQWGLLLTTVQEGGHLDRIHAEGGTTPVGTVISTNMEAEYTDFELREEPNERSTDGGGDPTGD